MSWPLLAVISAIAAGVTSVFAKAGLEDVPSSALRAVSRGLDVLDVAEANEMRAIYQQIWAPVPAGQLVDRAPIVLGRRDQQVLVRVTLLLLHGFASVSSIVREVGRDVNVGVVNGFVYDANIEWTLAGSGARWNTSATTGPRDERIGRRSQHPNLERLAERGASPAEGTFPSLGSALAGADPAP